MLYGTFNHQLIREVRAMATNKDYREANKKLGIKCKKISRTTYGLTINEKMEIFKTYDDNGDVIGWTWCGRTISRFLADGQICCSKAEAVYFAYYQYKEYMEEKAKKTEEKPVCPTVKRLTDKMIDKAIEEKNVRLLIAYAIHAGHLAGQLFQSAKNGARVMESSRWCSLTLKFDRAHEEAFKIDCKQAFREIYGQSNGAYPNENDQVYALEISDFCC